MHFTKMQGCGNDYVYVNGFVETVEGPETLARQISDRHFGVGSDGLILVLPSEVADFRMRMFNSDGSEGTMCGNGARCVGRFVWEKGLTKKHAFTLETGGGIREIQLHTGPNGEVERVTVDMGVPQITDEDVDHVSVWMGNPHRIYWREDDPFVWDGFMEAGKALCAQLDANIEFVQVLSRDHLRMRVYERGSGETFACGSGACASAVAACHRWLCEPQVTISMRGGDVQIDTNAKDGHVLMTGPAEIVFEGEWPA